ncbi:hypothetical protein Sango_0636900 [Sesamum angolense]|uniref:Uncharacterized protein n=1 Tax=Sesamum angolense TaxID=2727404 RepID=A0AAE1X7T4_9LAMI|nr:hypothetical protein Sango_0636900 [Sesamum angolense]
MGAFLGSLNQQEALPLQNMEEPLHLLEAFRRLLVSDCVEPKKHHLCFKCKWLCCFRVEQEPHSSKSSWSESRFGPIANANLATGVSSATSSTYNKFLCCSRVQETHRNLETITISSVHNKFLCCSRVQETHSNTTPSIYNKFLCCTTVQETHDNQAANMNMNTNVDPRTRANQSCSDPVTDVGPTTVVDQTTNRCSRISNFLSWIKVHMGVTREGSKVDHKRDLKKYVYSFRSATNLKAKGIYFKPSSSQSLKDARFNSYLVYAQLELPTWGVSIYTKSLIECTEDVKELREQKILYNMLADEQVRDVYKEIKTYGNPPVFRDLQKKIQAHYNSKMKTWIAELIHTHFRTPWTVIGLLAAMSLLALASVNVYYSIHKKSKK